MVRSPFVASVATLVICGLPLAASSQVYRSVSNRTIPATIHQQGSKIYDTDVDPEGNRYISGINDASGSTQFVAKLSSTGNLIWKTNSTGGEQVAADGSGHVYVAFVSLNSTFVRQLDAATGAINWTGSIFFAGGSSIEDLKIASDGSPVTATLIKNPAPTPPDSIVVAWTADGTNLLSLTPNLVGATLARLAMGPSGEIFGCGTAVNKTTGSNDGLLFFGTLTTLHDAVTPKVKTDQNGVFLSDLAYDFLGAEGIAVGFRQHRGGSTVPVRVSFKPKFTGTTYGLPDAYGDLDGGTSTQVKAINVVADPVLGGWYASLWLPDHPEHFGVVRLEKGRSALEITQPWSKFAPDGTQGNRNFPIGLGVDARGPVVAVSSDLVIGSGATAYEGVESFAFSTGGIPIDRQDFGEAAIDPPLSQGSLILATGVFSAFDFQSKSTLRTAAFTDGPDDSYDAQEDTTFTVNANNGVLSNDANGFNFDPRTVEVTDTTLAAGLASVKLNPDGSLIAKFQPNFNGPTHFNYRVIQDGVTVGNHRVNLHVKPVNDAPVAIDDEFTVAKGSPVQNLDVLANDSDVDGDLLEISDHSSDPNATINVTADKKFITFKPKPGFKGDVTFTYTVRDPDKSTATATVTVHVTG